MADDRKPTENQLNDLPGPCYFITGHKSDGTAIIQEKRPAPWTVLGNGQMAFSTVYTNDFPADLNSDADLKAHDEVVASGKLGLAKKNGTVCRIVDFAPGLASMMHRTVSVDFGVVIEGTAVLGMDDGSETIMQRGDVAVQRGTNHAWKNGSETEWLRILFVLQDCKPLMINGVKFGEDISEAKGSIPPSGNDE